MAQQNLSSVHEARACSDYDDIKTETSGLRKVIRDQKKEAARLEQSIARRTVKLNSKLVRNNELKTTVNIIKKREYKRMAARLGREQFQPIEEQAAPGADVAPVAPAGAVPGPAAGAPAQNPPGGMVVNHGNGYININVGCGMMHANEMHVFFASNNDGAASEESD